MGARGPSVTRFEREARATGSLGHPHIVQVTDFNAGPPPYLVMELLVGRSLHEALAAEGRLAPPRAIHIAMQVLSALSAAHSIGIVHRDIKPANLHLVQTGTQQELVKVLDFGIAKDLSLTGADATRSGYVIGTVGFMAPEQALGLAVDARADIYAVGAVLYLALSGTPPLRAGTVAEMMQAVTRGVVPLETVAPGLPRALCGAVDRALAFDPMARLQDAGSFALALALAAGMEPPSWCGASAETRHEAAPPAARASADTSIDPARPSALASASLPTSLNGPLVYMPVPHAAATNAPSHRGLIIGIGAGLAAIMELGAAGVIGALLYRQPGLGMPGADAAPASLASAATSTGTAQVGFNDSSVNSAGSAPKPSLAPTAHSASSGAAAAGLAVADKNGAYFCERTTDAMVLCPVRLPQPYCRCVAEHRELCLVSSGVVCTADSDAVGKTGAPCRGRRNIAGGKISDTEETGIYDCDHCVARNFRYSGKAGMACEGIESKTGISYGGVLRPH